MLAYSRSSLGAEYGRIASPATVDAPGVSASRPSAANPALPGHARPAVRLLGATKLYGDYAAADHVTLDIADRELFTLFWVHPARARPPS